MHTQQKLSGGRWVFDLESNGLLDTIHTIWCIVCRNIDTGEVREYGPSDIKHALELLANADEIIGHNILGECGLETSRMTTMAAGKPSQMSCFRTVSKTQK